jgi:hypothetical protein
MMNDRTADRINYQGVISDNDSECGGKHLFVRVSKISPAGRRLKTIQKPGVAVDGNVCGMGGMRFDPVAR